jgi:hypothetical protein
MKNSKDAMISLLKYLVSRDSGVFLGGADESSGVESSSHATRLRRLLDPQPLPPRHSRSAVAPRAPEPVTELNAFDTGYKVANDFLQLTWTARSLGLDSHKSLTLIDETCGTGPRQIELPPHHGAVPPVPRPEWRLEFQLGVLSRLCTVTSTDQATAIVVEKARERVAGHLENTLEQLST